MVLERLIAAQQAAELPSLPEVDDGYVQSPSGNAGLLGGEGRADDGRGADRP